MLQQSNIRVRSIYHEESCSVDLNECWRLCTGLVHGECRDDVIFKLDKVKGGSKDEMTCSDFVWSDVSSEVSYSSSKSP